MESKLDLNYVYSTLEYNTVHIRWNIQDKYVKKYEICDLQVKIEREESFVGTLILSDVVRLTT